MSRLLVVFLKTEQHYFFPSVKPHNGQDAKQHKRQPACPDVYEIISALIVNISNSVSAGKSKMAYSIQDILQRFSDGLLMQYLLQFQQGQHAKAWFFSALPLCYRSCQR